MGLVVHKSRLYRLSALVTKSGNGWGFFPTCLSIFNVFLASNTSTFVYPSHHQHPKFTLSGSSHNLSKFDYYLLFWILLLKIRMKYLQEMACKTAYWNMLSNETISCEENCLESWTKKLQSQFFVTIYANFTRQLPNVYN